MILVIPEAALESLHHPPSSSSISRVPRMKLELKFTPHSLQKITIDDVIPSITWHGYNLRTRKNEEWLHLWVMHSVFLKVCQIHWQYNYTILTKTLFWLSCDLFTIYRPDTKWELDLVYLVLQIPLTSNFFISPTANNLQHWWQHLGLMIYLVLKPYAAIQLQYMQTIRY